MAVIHKSFLTVSEHFPVHNALIQQLFQSSAVFRETCMDYHKCSNALHFWSNLSSPEALLRGQEYSVLLHELEQEILQSIAFQDSEKDFI